MKRGKYTQRIPLNHTSIIVNNEGISEIIGTVLLLLIAVALFSVLFAFVLSIPTPQNAPDAQIIFSFDDDNITITHLSGESVDIGSVITFFIDDEVISEDLISLSAWDVNNNSKFNLGESIIYRPSSGNLSSKNVSLHIVDPNSNTMVMTAVQYVEPIVTTDDPILSNPYPSFNAKKIPLNETLGITVFDADEDDLNITWYSNASSSSFEIIGTDTGGNKRYYFTPTNLNSLGTTYYWKVSAYDGTEVVTSAVFKFKTVTSLLNSAPQFTSNPTPANNSINIQLSTPLSISISDADGDNVTVYFYQQNGSLIGSDTVSGNGTASINWSSVTQYNTTYHWYVVADDSQDQTTSALWSFTTLSVPNDPPNQPSNPSPSDLATGVSTSPTLSVTVTDSDGDSMNVTFYNASDDSIIGTDTLVSNGSTASIVWSGLSEGLNYSWYAIANDSMFESAQSSTWTFKTQAATVKVVEFEDSFENGQWDGKWVEDSQNDWYTSTRRKTDGSYSAEVDGNANYATLTMVNSMDLSGKSSATLNFSWYIEKNWDDGECIKLEIYDGSTWTELASLDGNVDQENTWHHESINLNSYLVNNVKIRFSAKVSNKKEDGNVDNVQIVSYT